MNWKKILNGKGITEKDFDACKKELSKKFGKEVDEKDVIWSLLNSLVIKGENPYYEMALFLNEEEKDPFEMIFQMRKKDLENFKEMGIIKIKILSSKEGCINCDKLYNKEYEINEALKSMPLPNKKCSYLLGKGKYPFCRCVWQPILD